MGIIYKITNTVNNKIYVGKTSKTIEKRWKKHYQAAYSGNINTVFAAAIRKYGKENFILDVLEDNITDPVYLCEREIYWIDKLHSTIENDNYNTTHGGEGGSYILSEDRMKEISKKLRNSKLGGKNPNARAIFSKNYITGEEKYFDSVSECMTYYNFPNKEVIIHRCCGKTKSLYKRTYFFRYACDDDYCCLSVSKMIKNRKPCFIADITNDKNAEMIYFDSIPDALRYFGINTSHQVKIKNNKKKLNDGSFIHKIKETGTVLKVKFLEDKCVSTISKESRE